VFFSTVSTEDIETIVEIESESFAQPWNRQAIMDELACPEAAQSVAKAFSQPQARTAVIAYIFVRFLTDEMHIMKIAVDSHWRSRGTGSALLRSMLTEGKRRGADKVLLEVRPSNFAAIRLYEKSGFQTIGIRPNYYPQTGETALVMSKSLKEES
jgi:[ribosomal protein S18]-alanine N-acetyltransferase